MGRESRGDWRTMTREHAVTDKPNHDAVCFHAQQCVEKYLKTLLVEIDVPFPKIHDLERLLKLLGADHPELLAFSNKAAALTAFGVEFRYPGENAELADATDAVLYCVEIRSEIRSILKIEQD